MKGKLLSFVFFCGASLLATEEQQHSLWYYHPLHVGGQFIGVGNTDCTDERPNHLHNNGNVSFNKTNAFISMMTPISRHHIFFPRLEYDYITFDWNKNRKFNETHFYYLQFDLMYYCTALEHWKWIARFDYSLQIKHFSHPGQYSLYNGLLWGAYELNPKWHYHVGALGYAGMEGFNIYPIIGLDYAPDNHWFFQALFPINYSIEYRLSDWTFAVKGRPLKERLRSGSHEPQPRSVFSYSSMGSEINVRYERQLKFSIEGYGGYNWGGTFYIKDSHGKHAEYVNFNGSIYGGASIDYGF